MTDYPDYGTPQAHANAIAATGAPLLALATSIFKMANPATVAVNTTFTVPGGPFAISQIGYEMFVQIEANPASIAPFGDLTLTWSDSISGNVVAVETYALAAASDAFQQFSGTGPSKGDTLAVTFHNYDLTQTMQFQMSMVQNSRVYVRDDLRQITNHTVPIVASGVYDQAAGILLAMDPTINAGASQSRLIAFYSGQVGLFLFGPLAFTASIAMEDGALGGLAGNNLWQGSIAAAGGGVIYQQITLPRLQCILTITNNGASNLAFQGVIALSEQLP